MLQTIKWNINDNISFKYVEAWKSTPNRITFKSNNFDIKINWLYSELQIKGIKAIDILKDIQNWVFTLNSLK